MNQIASARTTELFQELKAQAQRLRLQTESRCFRLVNAYPKNPDVLPALEFLLLESKDHQARAFELLCKHHTASREIGTTCVFLKTMVRRRDDPTAFPGLKQIEKLTRAVMQRNGHHEAVGLASLVLAKVLILRNMYEEPAREIQTRNLREAETLLTRVSQSFSQVRIAATEEVRWDKEFAGAEAQAELDELFSGTRAEIAKQLEPKFVDRSDLYTPKSRSRIGAR